MKLSQTHKKQWISHCIKAMLPPPFTEGAIIETASNKFLHAVYHDWYLINIAPYENLEIIKACNKTARIYATLKYQGRVLPTLNSIYFTQPHLHGRWVPQLSNYMSRHTYSDIHSLKSEFYSITNTTIFELNDARYAEYLKIKEVNEELNEKCKVIAKTIYDAIESVSTDKQLQDKYPAIYGNMPESITSAINKSIVTANNRKKLEAKRRAILINESEVELTPEEAAYKDAEFALQKAAFVSKL